MAVVESSTMMSWPTQNVYIFEPSGENANDKVWAGAGNDFTWVSSAVGVNDESLLFVLIADRVIVKGSSLM